MAFPPSARQPARDRPRGGRAYIKKYFERFPGIRAYIDETKAYAKKNGYVLTLFGRKCHYPDLVSSNPRSAPSMSVPRSTRGCRAAPPTSSAAP